MGLLLFLDGKMNRVKDTYELRLTCRKSIGPVEEMLIWRLAQIGIDARDLVIQRHLGVLTVSMFYSDRLKALKTKRRIETLFNLFLHVELLFRPAKGWMSAWKHGIKPFALGNRFYLIPLWQENLSCPDSRMPLYLETTNAFGTGLHETTRFTIELIESLSSRGGSFLDIGCGSGILSIAAGRLGMRRVRAIDFDRSAVCVARANLKANGLPSRWVMHGDITRNRSFGEYELVAANLVTEDLLANMASITGHVASGGDLIVSGISRYRAGYFLRHFHPEGFRKVAVKRGQEWVAVHYRRGHLE